MYAEDKKIDEFFDTTKWKLIEIINDVDLVEIPDSFINNLE